MCPLGGEALEQRLVAVEGIELAGGRAPARTARSALAPARARIFVLPASGLAKLGHARPLVRDPRNRTRIFDPKLDLDVGHDFGRGLSLRLGRFAGFRPRVLPLCFALHGNLLRRRRITAHHLGMLNLTGNYKLTA